MAPEEEDCKGAGYLALECNCATPVARERDREPLAFGARTKTASAAPEEEHCEDGGDLALECNRSSLVVWEREWEPDGRWNREPLASEVRIITASAVPKEEDCEDAGDLAPEYNLASPLVRERDRELDGRRNWEPLHPEPGTKHQVWHPRRKTAKLQAT